MILLANKNEKPNHYNDFSAGSAIQELKKNHNPVKCNPAISKDEMIHSIFKGISDKDNQSASKEYIDFKKFVTENNYRMSPDAKKVFSIYESYARNAQSQGRTGLNTFEMKQMRNDMRNVNEFKHYTLSNFPQYNLAGQNPNIIPINNGYQPVFPGSNLAGQAPAWSSCQANYESQALSEQALRDQSQAFALSQNQRSQQIQNINANNSNTDKIMQQLLAALQSGKIDLAMMLFSNLESKEATQMNAMLTQKLVNLQQSRKQIMVQMDQKGGDQKNLNTLQANVQEVNDSIQMMTSVIKDINEQKNRIAEFANNYLSTEHQTSMSIVRGMR